MTKNIIIAILAIFTIMMYFYGHTKSLEAERSLKVALENQKIAMAAKDEANRQRLIADQQRLLAAAARQEADRLLIKLEKLPHNK